MKSIRLISALVILLFFTASSAQNGLPPIWGNTSFGCETRVVSYLSPQRILWKDVPSDAKLENEASLLNEGIGQGLLSQGKWCHLHNGANGEVSLLLDFGKELQGGIQIVTGMSATHDAKIRIRFGESASEAMCDIDGKNGATNDHAIRDLILPLPWLGVAEYGNTGFRFVRIDLIGANSDLLLKEVRASFKYRNIPYKGSFECDDERLNKIWMTGAYTVHLNMQNYLWDGIKRDRLVWPGDIYPEVMTINTVFGYNDVVPKSLDVSRDAYPIPNWMCGYSSYSIWWLLTQYQWYMYQGNLNYLREQHSYIVSLLNLLLQKIDSKGKETLNGNRFLDWPSSENAKGIDAGLQALMVLAMRAGAQLAGYLGERDLSQKCVEASDKLCEYVPDCNHCKQAAALMSLAGMMDAKKASNDVIAVGGAKDFSTFYGYYMLQAMAKAGNYQGAMDIISEYWGAMIDLGATTFWEDFNIDWMKNAARIDELPTEGQVDVHKSYGNYCYRGFRHSFCHGWASGPTAWLSEYVLGVKILDPGCARVLVEPHLGNLKWVKGTFPTPKGVIRISHKKVGNKVVSEIKAPREIIVILKNK
jgi:alpha-L-rhamnosidase